MLELLSNPQTIAVLCGFSFFLLFLGVWVLADSRERKRDGRDNQEWLFTHWDQRLYSLFYRKKEPKTVLKGMKENLQKYEHDCKILRETPKYEKIALNRILTVFTVVASSSVCVLMKSPAALLMGLCLALWFSKSIFLQAKRKAEKQRKQLREELPRFLDMLETALQIGIPIEAAIGETADKIPGVLSMELAGTSADVELGTNSWIASLERLARDYDVNDFSDFVLDLVTSYSKGVSVRTSIRRKNREIQESAVNEKKRQGAKLSSAILLPVVLLEILPMIVIMILPMVSQIQGF